MEPDKAPRELSKDLISNLARGADAADNGNKVYGFLQVIRLKEDCSQVELSDGFSSIEVLVFKTLRPRIQSEVRPLDILWTGVLKHKETVFVLFEFSRVYQNVGELVGRPLSFEEYRKKGFHNLAGSTQIPSKISGAAGATNQGPSVEDDDDDYTPISLLTPGSSSWAIKARVAFKSEIKTLAPKISGKEPTNLFSIILFDKSGKVSATFYRDSAQKYWDYLEVGKVYVFASGDLKRRTNYTPTNSPVEINFSNKCDITKCASDGSIPKEFFEFKKCKDIAVLENNTVCDLVGIVLDIESETSIMTKKNETLSKQVLRLGDDSETETEITFWGQQVHLLKSLKKGDLLVLTSLRVSEFKGKNLAASNDTSIITKMPDHQRVKDVIIWRNQKEKSGGVQNTNFASLKTVTEAKESVVTTLINLKRISEELSGSHVLMSQRPPSFVVCAWLTILPMGVSSEGPRMNNQSYYYLKCPNDKCYKKAEVDESDPNRCNCNACGVQNKPPIPRFIGTLRITDTSDSMFVKMSSDYVGQTLFGKTCTALYEMEKLDPEAFREYVKERLQKLFYFRIYPKNETYNGEIKLVYNCSSAYPTSGKTSGLACKNMMATIKFLQNKLMSE